MLKREPTTIEKELSYLAKLYSDEIDKKEQLKEIIKKIKLLKKEEHKLFTELERLIK